MDKKLLDTLKEKYGPCKLTVRTDYFAVLCDSIISQQLSTKVADTIYARFTAYFDSTPTPERVAETSVEQLRACGLSGRKALYLLDLAAKFLDGTITPERFPTMTDEEIVSELIKVKGIGVWTAQIFLIFALNRPDVFPVDDLGLQRAVMKLYDLPDMPDRKQTEEIASRFLPNRTMAAWYFWRSLENKPTE